MKATTSDTFHPSVQVPRLGVADWLSLVLMIIGAINWGLVGAINFNLVAAILGEQTLAARVVYVLVGLAGLYGLSMPARLRPRG
ncbi:DUF378 domain-containing protein [Variovorax sp. UMC13]|uniref:DUF378 domain-containing protein n=1 Tax=Variovorax sp. UMC13 TaxID=1862326 RepID=UPI0016033D82|nr:DUF378 domain-containing protein [Variovorax sp. UMC13]MBB1600463.1 DUF378 domain-containing protein [Variovorax sp. UMC13]